VGVIPAGVSESTGYELRSLILIPHCIIRSEIDASFPATHFELNWCSDKNTMSPRKKVSPSKTPATKVPSQKKRVLEPEVLPREEEKQDDDDEREDEEHEGEIEAFEADAPKTESHLPALSTPDDLPETTAVSLADPLRRYMEEVKLHPLLTPEDEFKLAVELKETGSIEAAKKLVQANLRLVVKIAFEYRSIYTNILDLVQEGNIGLMKAVSKYDPSKGARLGYYASWWIRSYILKYLLDNFRLVKVGTTQAQKKLFYHLLREKERLEAQGLLAGPKLLAQQLNVREQDVVEMQQRLSSAGSEVPLDAPVGDSDGESAPRTHLDYLASHAEAIDDTLSREQWLQILEEKIPRFRESLNDKERKILDLRLLAEEPKTLQEIADLYGLTRERARQIEAKMIEKLRQFLQSDLKEALD
jgi:RNA polymerase sigma-32 factor